MAWYLGLHVHEVHALGVDPDVHTDDLVVAGAGLGVDLSCKESRSVGRDVPAVLQEESLQVVHLFAQPLTGAQGLSEGKQALSNVREQLQLFYLILYCQRN